MRGIRLMPVLVGLAAIAMLTADASAVYHPTMGRFLQRDPGPHPASGARLGTGAPSVGAPFAPRDPVGGQYADGMNSYRYARSNSVRFTDPSGLHAWMTLSQSHGGIRVEVRLPNDEETVCGCLRIDYHAMGYFNDRRQQRSSGHAVFGEKGYVMLTYRLGKCKETDYWLKGTPEQDRTLVRWAVDQIGENIDVLFKDLDKEWSIDKRPKKDNRFYRYSVFEHNTCVQHAYEAGRAYLGREWVYLRFDVPTKTEVWGADVYKRGNWLAEMYKNNFASGVYHGRDNDARARDEREYWEDIMRGLAASSGP